MRIGFSLLNNQGIEDVQALAGLAVRAEELGFHSVWVHDHVFNVGHVFDRIGSRPYYERSSATWPRAPRACGWGPRCSCCRTTIPSGWPRPPRRSTSSAGAG